jgi:hypothetical protein
MSEEQQDRRQFSRVLFDAWVELRQGDKHWNAALVAVKGSDQLGCEREY